MRSDAVLNVFVDFRVLVEENCPHERLARGSRDGLRRRLQPRAVARGGVGAGRGADARGRRQRWSAWASSPGRCSSPRPGATSSAGSTGSWTCCTRAASASTSRPRPPPRRRGSRARTPTRCRSTATGGACGRGGRQAYCPSSPAYREAAVRLVEALAEPLRRAPGARDVARQQRVRLPRRAAATATPARPRSATGCSAATATSTRSTTPGAPRSGASATTTGTRSSRRGSRPTSPTPTQQLDYRRFSSDELLACFEAEREVLRRVTPGVPVTTNFMVPRFQGADYWAWAPGQDVVSNDHYLVAADGDPALQIALAGDVTRGLAGGSPWLLMEHSTSAVNWQPRNLAKQPGPDAPQQPRARGPRLRRRHVLPVARLPGRRREVPLGDGAARRDRHEGLARGLPARRRPRAARRGVRQPRRRRRGDRLGLPELVGGRARLAPFGAT